MPTKQKSPLIQQIIITVERDKISRTVGVNIVTDKPGSEISAMQALDIVLEAAKMMTDAALQS